jgi:hypothetical protein
MTMGVIKKSIRGGKKFRKKIGQVLANPRVYPLLPWLILMSILLLGTQSRAQGFEETTTGINESRGGLSAEEINLLDQESQKQYRNFIKGRASSSTDSNSRYSGALELHDSDFDGISDHGNSANELEGGLEEAAIGKRGLPDSEARNKKLTEAKEKARERVSGKSCKPTPQNPSPCSPAEGTSANVIDVGPAHGKDTPGRFETHRVYDLTEKAKSAAEKAGKTYADRALYDGANYDMRFANKDAVRQTTRKDQIEVLNVNPDGTKTWVRTKVGTDIDLIRSEISWLEDQKERWTQNEWKYRRAKRLAGAALGDDKQIGETVSGIYSKNFGKNSKQADLQLANAIYGSRVSSGFDICGYDRNSNAPIACPANGSVDPKAKKTAAQFAQENKLEGKARNEFFAKVSQLAQADPKTRAARQKEVNQIANCFSQDAWCDNSLRDLSKVRGADVGDAYQDTREYLANAAQRASQGPLSQMVRQVENIDFNASIDSKAKVTKPYQTYKKQVADAVKSWAEFMKTEREKEKKFPWYKSPYNENDINRMSARQLFERNKARGDGSTFFPTASTNSSPSQNRGSLRVPTSQNRSNSSARP